MICVLNGNFLIRCHESVSTTKTATRGSVFAAAVAPCVSLQPGSGISPLRLGHRRALSVMTVIKGQSTCQPTLKKLSYKDWPVEAHSPSFCVILWQPREPQMWSVWAGIMRNSERRSGRPPSTESSVPASLCRSVSKLVPKVILQFSLGVSSLWWMADGGSAELELYSLWLVFH